MDRTRNATAPWRAALHAAFELLGQAPGQPLGRPGRPASRQMIVPAIGLAAGLLAAAAPALALPPVPPPERLWGRLAIADRWQKTGAKWQAMAARHAAQRAAMAAGRTPAGIGAGAVRRWQAVQAAHAGTTGPALLAAVDAAMDRLPWRSDREAHGTGDRWLTPLEFLEEGGDCEDYAIAKYFLLRELGVPAEALRLVVVRERTGRFDHAILLARSGPAGQGDWLVLDNLRPAPVPAAASTAYSPLYAIGEAGGFLYLPAREERS